MPQENSDRPVENYIIDLILWNSFENGGLLARSWEEWQYLQNMNKERFFRLFVREDDIAVGILNNEYRDLSTGTRAE